MANAAEIMCKLDANIAHHIHEHRLIVRRCGKGESKGYKAVIINFSVIRMEGPKRPNLQEALEALFDYTAEKLKDYLKDYEDMQFSNNKGEELVKMEGGVRLAVKKEKVKTAQSVAKGAGSEKAAGASKKVDGSPVKKS